MRRTPPKSRVPAEKVRVIIHTPPERRAPHYDEPPGYSGHNGGEFHDAGYRSGTGTFGFRQALY